MTCTTKLVVSAAANTGTAERASQNLTWLLQSAQVSYTPGFTPLATAYHFRFAFGMVERAKLSDQFGRVCRALNTPAQCKIDDWMLHAKHRYFAKQKPRIQRAAEEGLKEIFATKVKEGSEAQVAVVVMSADGAVRAMVGGRKTKVSGAFNRATQALRQTGSAFKPFVYATALELGYHWYDTVEDAPYTINIPGSGPWSPENYDRKFHGTVTLARALESSLNIPAVKVAESVGLDLVRKVAEDFGIRSDLAQGPALALGASESTLVEMTGAYAGILNGGSSVTPYGLVELRLQGKDEPLMDATGGIGERVIRESAARELIWMMHNVVTQGTGRRADLSDRQVAGKTGTTSAARDAWFIGFSADYVAGVWMGYDNNTPLTGVTGSGLPAEIWHEVMVRVHEGLPANPLPMSRPEPPADPAVAQGNGGGSGQPRQQRQDPLERLLRNIFGIRN